LRSVTVGRAVSLGFLACVLVLGAAGLSSLEDDDFCDEQRYAVERSSWTSELALWPPGWRCVFSLRGGRETTVEAGSVGSFLAVLAGELLIAAWVLRRWPRVTQPLRVVAVTMLAFSVAGGGGLVGGFVSAMLVGWIVGLPLAVVGDRELRRAAGEKGAGTPVRSSRWSSGSRSRSPASSGYSVSAWGGSR
jgi:hypothetical protein